MNLCQGVAAAIAEPGWHDLEKGRGTCLPITPPFVTPICSYLLSFSPLSSFHPRSTFHHVKLSTHQPAANNAPVFYHESRTNALKTGCTFNLRNIAAIGIVTNRLKKTLSLDEDVRQILGMMRTVKPSTWSIPMFAKLRWKFADCIFILGIMWLE